MNKTKIIPILIVLNVVLISAVPTEALVPIYALTSTDDYIAENDYELIFEEETTLGSLETYSQIWVKPEGCWPDNMESCTGAFGAEYFEDSNTEEYDQEYYDEIKYTWSLVDSGLLDVTDDVPNAGLALIYAPTPDAYFAQVYIGIQTGIYFYITEIVDPSASPIGGNLATNSVYGSEGIKEIAVTVAEKISEALGLPGFTLPIVLGSLILLATSSILIKKKRN